MPVIQHQNRAPGPPAEMAVDTPTMFPVPKVAAKEVARAVNLLMVAGVAIPVAVDGTPDGALDSAPEEDFGEGDLETDNKMPLNTYR